MRAPDFLPRSGMRRLSASALVLSLAGFCAMKGAKAEPSVFPTGTTIYDPARAFNSYVLFAAGDGVSRLIDLNGNVVHDWKFTGQPAAYIDPALIGGARGHIFVTLETEEGKGTDLVPGRVQTRITKTVGEVDWDGKPVWRFGKSAPGGRAQQHHDIARLPNGNTLVLSNIVYPLPGFTAPQVLDDLAYEVNPEGDIVWTWAASDHIDEIGFTPDEFKLLKASKSADYLHVNNLKPVGPNHWFDEGDQRFAPDNLLFNFAQREFYRNHRPQYPQDRLDPRSAFSAGRSGQRWPVAQGPASGRSNFRSARRADHPQGPSGRRQSSGLRQSGRGWLSARRDDADGRIPRSRDQSGHAAGGLAIFSRQIRGTQAGRSEARISAARGASPTATPSSTKDRSDDSSK